MGLVSSMVRRVAQGVAEQIAGRARGAELFERTGERAPSGPPTLPTNSATPVDAPLEGEMTGPGLSAQAVELSPGAIRVVDLAQLQATLAADPRPKVLHHWATWCDACVEELPRVDGLVARLGDSALVVGVSWELFERFGKDEFAVLKDLTHFVAEQSLAMPTLVFRGEPDQLFQALSLGFEQIPQTRILDAGGQQLHAFEGPMAEVDLDRAAEFVAAAN
jgi:thiol-disulfide isomerase/thioredoxin